MRDMIQNSALQLLVKWENGERCLPFTHGLSVREILINANVSMRSACGGIGACGLCLVRVEYGEVNAPTASELNKLSTEQIHSGLRLACQVRPRQDARISLVNPQMNANWRTPFPEEYTSVVIPEYHVKSNELPYGVAVDLGTTHIRLSLWGMRRGLRLTCRFGLNPQAVFGADVLSRLTAASASKYCAAEISDMASHAIGDALLDIAAHESCSLREIGKMAIVGNTAMLALLTGKHYERLLQPDYWTRELDCRSEDTMHWRLSWGIAEARVEIVQPLGGFIGSDLLAGVLATRLTEGPANSLLVDFGTNSEIALWDGAVLWVTSAAGGPAFEGCGLHCGMPAEPGAIYKIETKKDAQELHCEVIGGGEARGLCGSGMVDIIAHLLDTGALKPNGVFAVQPMDKYVINNRVGLTLGKRDIDVFQRAKAAIGAGTECLLRKASRSISDLRRICVCGAFGQFLNVQHAQDIGLLPEVSPELIELWGDSALAGCELLLFERNCEAKLNTLKRKSRVLNLSQLPEFEGLYVKNLYLQPVQP